MKKKVKSKKKKTNSEKILLGVFCSLLILVLILLVVTIKTVTKPKDNSDIKFTITNETLKDNISVSIDISKLKADQQATYKMKIINYQDNEINKKDLTYKINFNLTNKDGITLKLYKNDSDKDLLNGSTVYDNGLLKANNKQEDTYNLIIKSSSNMQKKDKNLLNIIIDS